MWYTYEEGKRVKWEVMAWHVSVNGGQTKALREVLSNFCRLSDLSTYRKCRFVSPASQNPFDKAGLQRLRLPDYNGNKNVCKLPNT
jgi:hypothetical protein